MAVDYSQQLAAETKRVLEERKWSLRQAEIRTRIGYGTIQHMATGKVPSAEMIAQWASAIKEDRNHWLRISGYSLLADDQPEEVRESAAQYRLIEQVIPEGFEGIIELTDENRALAQSIIRKLLEGQKVEGMERL